MGPSDDAVIQMIREALWGPDDVDRLATKMGGVEPPDWSRLLQSLSWTPPEF